MRFRSLVRILVIPGFIGLTVLVGVQFFTLYTGPWTSFVRPTREFLAAAATHDSIGLARLGASPAMIERVFTAAAQRPSQVGIDHLRPISGRRFGDTTRVNFLHTGCSGNLLVVSFLGKGSRPRIQEVSLPCGAP